MIESDEPSGPSEFQKRAEAHVAILDWLEVRTGTREGHDDIAAWAIKEVRKRVDRRAQRLKRKR